MRLFKSFFIFIFLVGGLTTSALAQIPTDSLQLHLNASLGITSSGDSVSIWVDQSGNGNDAFQNALTQRPLLVTNSMNGEPVLRFNGTNAYLTLPTASSLGIQNNDYEVFIVSRSSSINSNVEFLLAGNLEQYELHLNGSAGARFIPKTLTFIDEGAIGDYSDTNAHIYNVRATDTYGNVTVDAVNSTDSLISSRSSSDGNLYLGIRFDNSFLLNGDIAEVLIYNTVLSTTDRALVENYLGNKYDIDVPPVTPTVAASNVTVGEINETSLGISLTPGNGGKRIIIAKKGSPVDFDPVDNTTYSANAVFGSGSELGSGNYIVFNGTGDEVTITGLQKNIHYYFSVVEYNGDAGEELYFSGSPTNTDEFTSGFDFENISSLSTWLRADAGISNTVTSSPVNTWSDVSGNSANATATTAPVFSENSLNGMPGVSFNGTDQYLTLPSSADLGIQNSDYEIFIVSKPVNSTDVQFLMGGVTTTNYEIHLNGGQGVRYIPAGSSIFIDEGNTQDYSNGSGHIFHVKATSGGGYVQVNGSNVTTNLSNLQSSVNTIIDLGRRANNSFYLNGEIYEVLVFNSELSIANRDSVASYLSDKYDVSYPIIEAPTTQSSNLSFSNVDDTELTLNFTSGNGANRIILAKSGSAVNDDPIDGTSYTANSVFGSGTEIGSGNFVVYNGTGNQVTVTGLSENTEYHFSVIEYNGFIGEELYLTENIPLASQSTNFLQLSIQSQTAEENSSSSAIYTAVVNTSTSLSTDYRVIWGTNLAALTDTSSIIVKGTGSAVDTVSYELTGLSENTNYFIRLSATTSQESILSGLYQKLLINTVIPGDSVSVWLAADNGFDHKSNGDTLARWYDISGNLNNVNVNPFSTNPTITANSINGLPVVSLGNLGAFNLPTTGVMGIHNSDYEIFVVAKTTGTGGNTLIGGGSNAFNFTLNPFNAAFNFVDFNNLDGGNISNGEVGTYSDDNPYVFNLVGTNTGGSVKIDSRPEGTDTLESFWMISDKPLSLGGAYSGNNSDPFNDFAGDIAELIIYRRTLTGLERSEVHTYLSDKYNIDVPALSTPTEQVTNLELEKTGTTSAELSFTKGNGSYTLAIIKADSEVDAIPADSITYTASTVVGAGTEIGSGNFIVHAGADSSIIITGLTPGTTYYAKTYSFNGDPGVEKYLITNADTVSLFLPLVVLVSDISPASNSSNVANDTDIEITFDKAMNTSSFITDSSFTVRGSEGGLYTGTFQFSAGNTVVTFTSDSTFKAGETISVHLTNKLVGASDSFEDPRTFTFNIATSFSSGTFQRKLGLTQQSYAEMIKVSDLNADGKGDIITVTNAETVFIQLKNGNESYANVVGYNVDGELNQFVDIDIDGDADTDIIAINPQGSYFEIIKNNGNGTFGPSDSVISVNIGATPRSIESGDLDFDGDEDLIIGINNTTIMTFLNNGSGSFASPVSYNLGIVNGRIIDLAISDLDNDGDLDIVALNESSSFYISMNTGDGTFKPAVSYGEIAGPTSVSIGDLDKDGDIDVVISDNDDDVIHVYKNEGDGSFSDGVENSTNGLEFSYLTLSDIDGDGDLDALATAGGQYIYPFLNPGDGTFPSRSTLNINSSVNSFTLSDFDQDNDVDLFVSTSDSIYIYENIDYDPLTFTGSAGWRLIASPVGNVEYSGLLENLWTQGASNADTESGFSNVYMWPSTSATVSDTNWTAVTNLSDSLQSGSGMLMYVFSDDNGPEAGDTGFPKEINFPGVEPTSTRDLSSLINTNVNGWTLLGNPFFQDIDWDEFSRDDISNSVYVYDIDASGWKSWNGTLGSLTDGIINIYDAFFIQSSSGNPELTIFYPSEGGEGGGSVDKAVSTKNPHYFSIELSDSSGLKNKAWFQFSEDGQFGLDASDAHQLNPLTANYVTMASILNDTTHLDINSLPLITEPFEISLVLQTSASGVTHRISKGDLNLPEGWEVSLYDSELDITTDLEESYEFTMNAAKVKTVRTQDIASQPSLESVFRTDKQKRAGSRFTLTVSPSQAVSNEPVTGLPTEVELGQNYPNPFNPSTTIAYGVPNTGKVTLEVFDILGRKVATLLNGENKTAGRYTLNFNASNLASGMYIYRLQAGNVVMIKKLTLIK